MDDVLEIDAERVDKIVCRGCGAVLDTRPVRPLEKIACPKCGTGNYAPLRMGNFLLLELLGKGGMGAVYRGLDETLGRYVAIKVMRRSLAADRQFVENFLREARAAAALSHLNVVQVYSCGEWRGQPYIVMELVDGGRLDEEISKGEPMDEVRALEIALDVAEGLRAASQIGLVHGDIKPANILFDAHGTGKVADFGLARFARREPDSKEIWGTPYYIAPEKARGQKTDHRADIYSLGATIYHALGAKPPFEGETATDVVLARLKNPAIGLRVLRPSLQPETADVVARMLEADPFMRYPTYESLIADLREALRIAKQQSRGSPAARRRARTNMIVAVGIPVMLVLGVSSAVVISLIQLHRGRKSKPEHKPAVRVVARHPRAPAPPGKEKGVAATLDPFSDDAVGTIEEAATLVLHGKCLAAEERLQRLYDSLPETDMGRLWIRLFQTLTCICDRRQAAAGVYVNEIERAQLQETEKRHPALFVRTAVAYLLGKGNDAWLFVEASRWPAWIRDLAEFLAGARNLKNGSLRAARKHLTNYIRREHEEHTWVYAWRDVADEWLGQIAYYEELQEEFRASLNAGELEKAQRLWNAARQKLGVFLKPFLSGLEDSLQVARRKHREEQEKVALLKRQEQLQADLDILDRIRTENLPLVRSYEYEAAARRLRQVRDRLRTEEGRAAFKVLLECYDRMQAVRRMIISSVRQEPFTARTADMKGPIVDAGEDGLLVAVGAYGKFLRQWEKVPLSVLVEMADYYSGKEGDVSRKADRRLSVAVLCYMHGWFKAAARYASVVAETDPKWRTTIRRLMPGILEAR